MEIHESPQSGYPVSKPSLEPSTSVERYIQTNLFGQICQYALLKHLLLEQCSSDIVSSLERTRETVTSKLSSIIRVDFLKPMCLFSVGNRNCKISWRRLQFQIRGNVGSDVTSCAEDPAQCCFSSCVGTRISDNRVYAVLMCMMICIIFCKV